MYDYKTNEEIRKELNIHNANDIIAYYRSRWIQHLLRTNDIRIPKLVYEYILAGRRNVGWPREDGRTTTNKDGTSLAVLYPVTDDDDDNLREQHWNIQPHYTYAPCYSENIMSTEYVHLFTHIWKCYILTQINTGVGGHISSSQLFRDLNILPAACISVTQTVYYIKRSKDNFKANVEIQNYNNVKSGLSQLSFVTCVFVTSAVKMRII